MKPETTAKIKYGVWGLICGAVIAMIIGFAWGGWTTAGTSRTRTSEAVLASEAAIQPTCLQFSTRRCIGPRRCRTDGMGEWIRRQRGETIGPPLPGNRPKGRGRPLVTGASACCVKDPHFFMRSSSPSAQARATA